MLGMHVPFVQKVKIKVQAYNIEKNNLVGVGFRTWNLAVNCRSTLLKV